MLNVTLYGRPGCHLCADALDMLRRVQSRVELQILEVNIEEDDDLLKRYQWLIPVVEAEGRELARAPINEAALRRTLVALAAK